MNRCPGLSEQTTPNILRYWWEFPYMMIANTLNVDLECTSRSQLETILKRRESIVAFNNLILPPATQAMMKDYNNPGIIVIV